MAEIQTYPAMNENIAWLLRMTKDSPVSIYAAARIEELEAERERLLTVCEQSSRALLHVEAFLAVVLEADPHRITPMDEVIEARKQARVAVKEGRQPMREGGARDAESA